MKDLQIVDVDQFLIHEQIKPDHCSPMLRIDKDNGQWLDLLGLYEGKYFE